MTQAISQRRNPKSEGIPKDEVRENHPATLESKNDLGVLYKEQGDYDKAESLLVETLEGRRLKLGDTHPHTIESWHSLIDLYQAWGKSEEANQWWSKQSKD